MLRYRIGRILLTLSIVVTVCFQVIADWSVGHMIDPSWPPHAHYHLLVYHFTLILFGGAATYLLCGRHQKHPWTIQIGAFTGVAFWIPYFPAALFPEASIYATQELADRGIPVNLIMGAAFIACSLLGFFLARSNLSRVKCDAV